MFQRCVTTNHDVKNNDWKANKEIKKFSYATNSLQKSR